MELHTLRSHFTKILVTRIVIKAIYILIYAAKIANKLYLEIIHYISIIRYSRNGKKHLFKKIETLEKLL